MLKLKEVEGIPVSGKRHDLQSLIKEFADSSYSVAEIEFKFGSDYVSARVCSSCIANAIKRSRRYGVKVSLRGDRVFLVKTD